MIIMPTRKRMSGNSADSTYCSTVRDRVRISTLTPRKAILRRRFQKRRVPRMAARKTPAATCW